MVRRGYENRLDIRPRQDIVEVPRGGRILLQFLRAAKMAVVKIAHHRDLRACLQRHSHQLQSTDARANDADGDIRTRLRLG
jgi:hypothetical protein